MRLRLSVYEQGFTIQEDRHIDKATQMHVFIEITTLHVNLRKKPRKANEIVQLANRGFHF